MPRYFIEVAYKGTRFSGFQVQQNANTVQAEVEKAFALVHRKPVTLTGSSRTDAGVHARQNYFHFDFEEEISRHFLYKMNAVLPPDIVAARLFRMPEAAHARFDAVSREYEYRIYRYKDPFLRGLSHYYPYKLDVSAMEAAAALVTGETNFYAFTKTNTQVNNFRCNIFKSRWFWRDRELVYNIEGNRFLRGMVRLLTASMLKVGRGRMSMEEFALLFSSTKEKCGFSVPAEGLYLQVVGYSPGYFEGAEIISDF